MTRWPCHIDSDTKHAGWSTKDKYIICQLHFNMTNQTKHAAGQNNFQEQVQHDIMWTNTPLIMIVPHHTMQTMIHDHRCTACADIVQQLRHSSAHHDGHDDNKAFPPPPRSPLINHFNKCLCQITRPRLKNCCLYVLKYYILPPSQKRLPTLIINK